MKRPAVLLSLPLMLGLAACPKDKAPAHDTVAVAPAPAVDTAPRDLSAVTTALPPAAPDTFTPKKLPVEKPSKSASADEPSYPAAPGPLLDAVQREQAFSRFCFTEFGQKSDPTLSGGVAMLVTVSASGIDDARVANSHWSSSAGSAVSKCLNDKAHLAWKLEPGAVKPGKYVVPLTFRGG